MRVCSHVVTVDSGLAPNPFHGFCTTAICTPSHMNARLLPGDWLMGNSPKADGNRLVYAMRVSEVLGMDHYFKDPRFAAKKPNPYGDAKDQCGDNFYYLVKEEWRRIPSQFHNDHRSFLKDIGKNRTGRPVFVAEHFYYFGANRVTIPARFSPVIRRVQGIQYMEGELAEEFVSWLEDNFDSGVRGNPKDLGDRSKKALPMITELPPDSHFPGKTSSCGTNIQDSGRRGRCR